MASKTEKQPIIPGALNLLSPGDRIQAGGSLLQDNWRADQNGELRSRKGTEILAPQIGSGIFHTLVRAGADRFSGIGSQLWWGLLAQTLVASGFDGSPLGIAFYDAAGWVMNRLKQLRLGLGGSTSTQWGVGAPATAPIATAGAQQYVNSDGFDYLAEPAPGIDVGYQDASGVFHDDPQSTVILTNSGTIAVTNGQTAIVGTGTAFTQAMAGTSIEIDGTLNGVPGQWLAGLTTVTDATHATLGAVYDWDTKSGLSFDVYVTTPAAEADTTNFQEIGGQASLQVNASVAGTWIVTDNLVVSQSGPINTTTQGVAQDDDMFRMWVYCSNPAAVSSFAVVLISGASDVAGLSAYVTLPGSALNQTPKSWTLLQILRNVDIDSWTAAIAAVGTVPNTVPNSTTPVSANPAELAALQASYSQRLASPHFTQIQQGQTLTGEVLIANGDLVTGGPGYSGGQPTSINWAAISAMQVLVALTAPCVFNLDNAYFTGAVAGVLTGTGNYFVSFANQWNEDGDISPASNTITCQGQSAELTAVPISPDPQVTQRWIWRLGFGSTEALQVGQISDNVTTTFIDTVSVVSAQDTGLVAPGSTANSSRTLPPPCSGVMGPYLSQLIAWGHPLYPCRYFWTEPGIPWAFPGANDPNVGTWEDAGSADDALVYVTNHQLMALFYKQRSLGRLYGSPDTADYQEVDQTCGLVGPRAVVNGGQVDYFMGAEGIYYRNYDSKEKISTDIDPIFKGDYVQLSEGEFIPPINPTWIGLSVLELCNDRLYVSYVEAGLSLPSVTLICQLPGQTAITDVPTYRWSRMKLNTTAIAAPQGFTALHYDGNPYALMGGVTGNWVADDVVATGGYLMQLETGDSTDNGQTIHVAWQSRFSDQGLPDNYKRYADWGLDFQTSFNSDGLSTLDVYVVYKVDGSDPIKVQVGTASSAVRTTLQFSLMGILIEGEDLRAKSFSVRVEGDINSTCILYGAYVHWYPEERVGTIFDSGFTNLGISERVKQVDYFELYSTGAGQQVTQVLYADLPGSLLTVQQSAAITLPNGKGDVRQRLPEILEGRNLRMVLSGSPAYQIHQARLRQRVIGEYIDGTIGEYFESPEFSVAPGRDGELKDLLLDYDSSAAGGLLKLYADANPPEAGATLSVVRTLTIPTGTRRTFAFAFEDSSNNLPYGTLFKIRIYPAPGGILRLHGRATIRARLIGVCFDGGAGEQWLTQPIDLFGGMGVFRELAIVAQTGGPMNFTMFTELPNEVMTAVSTIPVNSPNATSRIPVFSRLPGTTKGQLQQFQLSGPYWARLFEVKVLGRGLGNSSSEWEWRDVPMEATPNEWQQIQMPVRATPEEFTWVDLPVDVIE
jgi:hypothetical protein